MSYLFADLLYQGKVFRILKPYDDSSAAINEMLKRQGVIQVQDLSVITLFNYRGRYMHTARTEADQELALDFLNANQIPSYSVLVWVQAVLVP